MSSFIRTPNISSVSKKANRRGKTNKNSRVKTITNGMYEQLKTIKNVSFNLELKWNACDQLQKVKEKIRDLRVEN